MVILPRLLPHSLVLIYLSKLQTIANSRSLIRHVLRCVYQLGASVYANGWGISVIAQMWVLNRICKPKIGNRIQEVGPISESEK